QARLVRECGIQSAPTLRKALDELIAADLITETRRGLNRTNLYHVHKLPLVLMRDAKNIAIQRQKNKASRSAKIRLKVHPAETHPAETGARSLHNEEAALVGTARRAGVEVGAVLVAWEAAGRPPWLEWWQNYTY